MLLYNKYSRQDLLKQLGKENFSRITLSFYRYVYIDNVDAYRYHLYKSLSELAVLGRIYVAVEGINAQINVPEPNLEAFRNLIENEKYLQGVHFNFAVDEKSRSFVKLIVRVRNKIVADGLKDFDFDVTNAGKHLTAKEFNEQLKSVDTIVVDMRNHYESEIGHFENAICPDVDTFRQALPYVANELKDKKDKKILLYCTGGIRCEKASAYLRDKGFKNVYQLHGGIVRYIQDVKQEKLESRFLGVNFVFDERLGERVTNEIISTCHQCDNNSARHTNCANPDCHLLFIQCIGCAEKMKGCCSNKCYEIIHLPVEEQKRMRKGKVKTDAHAVFKSRLRPKLRS